MSARTTGYRPGVRQLCVAVISLLLIVAFIAWDQPAVANQNGSVGGQIVDAKTKKPVSRIKIQIFTMDWQYVKQRKADSSGGYFVDNLPPGRYRFRYIDKRPRYNVSARIDKDHVVRVRANRTTRRNVTMRRGGSITGSVKIKGRRGANATLIAVNQWGGAYEVKADGSGRFAIGGLTKGDYSVFTYDPRKKHTGKSFFVKDVKPGRSKNIKISINDTAGQFTGVLTAGGQRLRKTVWVTAVNKRTGQWWVQKIKRGKLSSLKGLSAGKYRLSVPPVAGYRHHEFKNIGKIRPGRSTFTVVKLKKRS